MLKKKIQELLQHEPNQEEKRFEIIHEAAAVQIVGGACTNLENCGTFEGSCGPLTSCGHFVEK